MLYTIAEISNLIHLSKVSIYKKLKLKEFQEHISKKQGVTYIDEVGFNLIKNSLKLNADSLKNVIIENKSDIANDDTAVDSQNFNIKIDYINTLKEQLKAKDLQIQSLNDRLAAEQELSKNRQILELKQHPNIQQLEAHFKQLDSKLEKWREIQEEKKKPWYKKLFK